MKDTIVLYPSPGTGHLNSMIELGKLIISHHSSFSVAIIIPAAPFETTSVSASASASIPSLTFHRLPPVPLPDSNTFCSPSDHFPFLMYQLGELNNPKLHETLITISKISIIKAFVIDFFCNAAFRVSTSLEIPTYYYFTSGANGLGALLYCPTLHRNMTKSFRELDNMLIDFPGLPPVPANYMPAAMLDRGGKTYECFIDTATQMAKSSGLIVNTFELLEQRAARAILERKCTAGESAPPIYCIGPLVGKINGDDRGDRHECLSWLDSQPSRSVVFLCFGSMGIFSSEQLREMAIGLDKSGVKFLWVVREPPPLEEFLPDGFLERTGGKGLVVKSWAPQFEVLNHDSVGGFVTHCGWNSVLEGVCAGVPMLAWPLYAEQRMNKVFVVEEMKVALALTQSEEGDGLVSAAELEERVTELMESEEGRAVRERVVEMKEAAVAAMRDGGSSLIALQNLTESFKRGCVTQLS